MSRSIRPLIAVAILVGGSLALVAGVYGQADPATPGASPAASPMASPAASPVAGVQVSIYDFGFEPAQVEVPVGTTVIWTMDAEVIHTTTDKAREKAWDSGVMEPGDTFSYTFTEAGTYEYWCLLHPNMVGTVVVTGS